MNELFYYKTKDEKGWAALREKSSDKNLIEITKEEWAAHLAARKAKRSSQVIAQKREIHSQIGKLKSQLAASDYQAIKYAEGWINESDYAQIKAHRQSLRDQINLLESQLANL